jgi:hypothetical protein
MLNPGYPPGAHRPYPAQVVEYLDDPYDDDYYDERPRPRRRANVIEGDAEEV